MTEHKKLKEICDLIGFESKFYFNTNNSKKYFEKEIETEVWEWEWTRAYQEEIDVDVKVNVREIIFTQEFMEKLSENNIVKNKIAYQDLYREIMFNLNDPVEYLYNTLWLWTKHK